MIEGPVSPITCQLMFTPLIFVTGIDFTLPDRDYFQYAKRRPTPVIACNLYAGIYEICPNVRCGTGAAMGTRSRLPRFRGCRRPHSPPMCAPFSATDRFIS